MVFRAVLFDAAETLFTTRGSVGEIYGSIARHYGSTASPAAIQAAFARQFRGAGPVSVEDQKRWWKDVVHRVFNEVGMVENFDQFFDQVYDMFRDSQGWILFPETIEVLTALRKAGMKTGIISNFDDRIYSVLQSLRIRDLIDTVTLSSESGFSKPSPEIFHAAIRALGFPPSEILLVGDNLRDDIEAGARAGLRGLLIDRGGRYSSANHIEKISSLKEVLTKVSP